MENSSSKNKNMQEGFLQILTGNTIPVPVIYTQLQRCLYSNLPFKCQILKQALFEKAF